MASNDGRRGSTKYSSSGDIVDSSSTGSSLRRGSSIGGRLGDGSQSYRPASSGAGAGDVVAPPFNNRRRSQRTSLTAAAATAAAAAAAADDDNGSRRGSAIASTISPTARGGMFLDALDQWVQLDAAEMRAVEAAEGDLIMEAVMPSLAALPWADTPDSAKLGPIIRVGRAIAMDHQDASISGATTEGNNSGGAAAAPGPGTGTGTGQQVASRTAMARRSSGRSLARQRSNSKAADYSSTATAASAAAASGTSAEAQDEASGDASRHGPIASASFLRPAAAQSLFKAWCIDRKVRNPQPQVEERFIAAVLDGCRGQSVRLSSKRLGPESLRFLGESILTRPDCPAVLPGRRRKRPARRRGCRPRGGPR